MCSRRSILVVLLALTVAAGCSKSAQQFYESGNKYFAEQKFKEAVVEYRNAIQSLSARKGRVCSIPYSLNHGGPCTP